MCDKIGVAWQAIIAVLPLNPSRNCTAACLLMQHHTPKDSHEEFCTTSCVIDQNNEESVVSTIHSY